MTKNLNGKEITLCSQCGKNHHTWETEGGIIGDKSCTGKGINDDCPLPDWTEPEPPAEAKPDNSAVQPAGQEWFQPIDPGRDYLMMWSSSRSSKWFQPIDPGRDYPEGQGEVFVRVRANVWKQAEESRKYQKENNAKLMKENERQAARIRELEAALAELKDSDAEKRAAYWQGEYQKLVKEGDRVAEVKIELANVVSQLKDQHERVAALEAGRDLDPGWRKGDHREVRGILADKAEPEWPEVEVMTTNLGWSAVISKYHPPLTRAQAEAVVRAYDATVRCLSPHQAVIEGWTPEQARRILRGE